MNDLLDSIRAQIYARLSSPLFGAFVISWLCWNHRYLFILFSELPVQERFTLAQSAAYPGEYDHWLRGFLWPLGCSAIFILAYPYPSRWFFQYWHKREVETKKLRDEIEGLTLLTQEESRKIIIDSIKVQDDYEEAIQSLNRQVESLRQSPRKTSAKESSADLVNSRRRIRDLEEQLALATSKTVEVSDPLDQLSPEIRAEVLKMIGILASSQNMMLEASSLGAMLNLSAIRADYIFDKATQTKLFGNTSGYIQLTKAGRDYAIEKLGLNK